MRYSVIVVCLNPGDKLAKTINSILAQDYKDYEILIKDGLSTDGSVDALPENDSIVIYKEKDTSIYDAMNQAVKYAKGDYFIFMNCGDAFAHNGVLSEVSRAEGDIIYGDMKRQGLDDVIPSPHKITDFVCYRNIPCHQVCFYNRRLFAKRGYDTSYPVRADYEHFLYSVYEEKATTQYVDTVVALYEGDGFSETKEHEKQAKREHAVITKKYLKGKCFMYKMIMIITLQPLRKWMAGSKVFSGLYQGIKRGLYGRK